MSSTNPQQTVDSEQVRVKFHPQVWDNGYALTGDAFEFTVPRDDAIDEDGELLEDATGESDQLRNHPNAPKKATKWQGPFFVTLEEIE